MSSLRDDAPRFEAAGTVILPVNPASPERHRRWAERHRFPFPILSDPDRKVARAYGARSALGIRRTVVIVRKDGAIGFREEGMPADDRLLEAIRGM